ncbi:hypothetical protein KAI87_17720 [Myxococcota bacterium]|nr:hypothetical protein [Myxococcota bacterium]
MVHSLWFPGILILALSTTIACGTDSTEGSGEDQIQCEPVSYLPDLYPIRDGGRCKAEEPYGSDPDCNQCKVGSLCVLGAASGKYLTTYTTIPISIGDGTDRICTHSCSGDSSCGAISYEGEGWDWKPGHIETWTCTSVGGQDVCTVDIQPPEAGDSCGEPCPQGCCSPSGLSCCQPPFCAGDCASSPCC